MPEVEKKVLEEKRVEYMPPYLMFFPPEASKRIDALSVANALLAPHQETLAEAHMEIEASCPIFTKEGSFLGFPKITINAGSVDVDDPAELWERLKKEGCQVFSVTLWPEFDVEVTEGVYKTEKARVSVTCGKISAADLYEKLKLDMKQKYPTLADFRKAFGDEFGYCEVGIEKHWFSEKPLIEPDSDVATYILVMREIYHRMKSKYPEMMHAFGGCVEERIVRKVGEVVRG